MKKIGLALGGGAVLGAAHVGIIRALSEKDYEVKQIAGTSIGAMVGAFYAFGKDWKEIQEIASELEWIDISNISLSKFGLLNNDKMGDLIQKHIGDKLIEDAQIPLSIVATDVSDGSKVVLTSGSVAEAVRASTCIPGIFEPVEIDGKLLIDGGVAENVPIKTVKGATNAFAVGVDLNYRNTYSTPINVIEVVLNSFHFLMQKSDRLQTESADLLLKPDLSSFNRTEMSQIDALIDKGYEEALKFL